MVDIFSSGEGVDDAERTTGQSQAETAGSELAETSSPRRAEPASSPRSEAFLTRAMSDWGDAVYRLALSQTRSKVDAEDVYQDVFLRLYNDTTHFQSNKHLKAWLLRVTMNRCHDLARSAWNRRTVALDLERDNIAAPDHDSEDTAVWEAVGQLPEQQRIAVHLHYVEGYSTDEIARIMQCQPSTARTWLFRARSTVKDLLTGDQAKPETLRSATQTTPISPPSETGPPPLREPLRSIPSISEPLPKGGLV